MGLDMYLNKRTFIGNQFSNGQPSATVNISGKTIFGYPINIKSERVAEVIEQVAYWRKANAIHGWFVRNVQNGTDDCNTYDVSPDHLKSLLDDVQTVLDNPERGPEILPTQNGFFFGSTAYDEFYTEDLIYTRDTLKAILTEDDQSTYQYQSSW